jgi:para-nitrobenzyl esterase
MPGAKGLFHKAIVQSGPGLRAVEPDAATGHARQLLDELGVKPGALGKLAELATDVISKATLKVPGEMMRIFSPVVDGVALPRHPFHPDAPTQSANVPVMIGTNKDEATLFMLSDPKFGDLTEEDLQKRAKRMAGDKAEALIAALREIYPDYSPTYLASAVQTATWMWIDSIRLAERKHAQGAAPAFMYMMTWETPVARGKLKCPHALEIPLVFDNVERARNFVGRGEDPQTLVEQMAPAWLAFARRGDPNHAGIPAWPAYDPKTRATMLFDRESRVVSDPNSTVREILKAGDRRGF